VFLSDVAALVEALDGVDHVADLALVLNGVPQGTHARVARDRMVAAGTIRVSVAARERQLLGAAV
jgi:hypothetical protein